MTSSEPSSETPGPTEPRYWFPAKRYGWGWGLPATWEGWVVLLAYLAALPLAVRLFPPERGLPGFLAAVLGLSALVIAICWWKGEPPRWRWG